MPTATSSASAPTGCEALWFQSNKRVPKAAQDRERYGPDSDHARALRAANQRRRWRDRRPRIDPSALVEFQGDDGAVMSRERGITPPSRAERMLDTLNTIQHDVQGLLFRGPNFAEQLHQAARPRLPSPRTVRDSRWRRDARRVRGDPAVGRRPCCDRSAPSSGVRREQMRHIGGITVYATYALDGTCLYVGIDTTGQEASMPFTSVSLTTGAFSSDGGAGRWCTSSRSSRHTRAWTTFYRGLHRLDSSAASEPAPPSRNPARTARHTAGRPVRQCGPRFGTSVERHRGVAVRAARGRPRGLFSQHLAVAVAGGGG